METNQGEFRIKADLKSEAEAVLERISRFTPDQQRIGLAFLNGVQYGQNVVQTGRMEEAG